MRAAFLLALGACAPTINASSYSRDCDADSQCTRILVGDLCSCSCTLSAINTRDYDRYLSDVQRVGGFNCHNTCIDGGDDAAYSCGLGIGAGCSAGTCVNVVVDAGAD